MDDRRDLDRCFQFDFTCSNILKFCKDEEMETDLSKNLHNILKENYIYIKSIYKYYASMTNQEVFCINSNNMTLLAKDFQMFDQNLNEVTLNLEMV